MRFYRSVAPTTGPVTLTEFRQFLRVDDTEEDTLLQSHLDGAVQMLDGWSGLLGRAIVTQTWMLQTPGPVNNEIRLFDGVQSVSSIAVIDNEAATTWGSSEYRLMHDARGSFVQPTDDYDWPSSDVRTDAFTVTFIAGYGAASAVPESLKYLVKSIAANAYRSPESDPINEGLRRQLNAFRGSFI